VRKKMSEDQTWRGNVGGMEWERAERFLTGNAFARVACIDGDGKPYVVPLWYTWDGEGFLLVIRERARIARYMKNNPNVSLVVDEMEVDDERGQFTLPKVFCQGRAEIVEEANVGGAWVKVAEEMSVRYLGPDGPTYLVPTLVQPRWLIKIVPEYIKTWEGVGWGKQYWVEAEGNPTYEQVHGLEGDS
jgi:nitroimidazol reductase NimA-like FMN-containing flavoprotein (pyridoxamine 5'-phosphate oxidase superfamily)